MTDPDQLPALDAPAPTSATSNTSARKQSLQSPLQPREGHVTPGHYRVRVAEKNLPKGTRVRVSQCVDGKVWLYRHSHSWTTPEAHFTENFEHAPDGESAYQGELQAIGEQIALASSKLQQAAAEAAALQPEMHGRVLTGTGEEDETLDRTFRAPDAPPRTFGS